MMANTMEAAPRSPAKDTKSCWEIWHRAGDKIAKTDSGRATKVMNTAIKKDGSRMGSIWDGVANKPSIKKMSICIKPVSPSKKCTRDCLPGIFPLPITIPTM